MVRNVAGRGRCVARHDEPSADACFGEKAGSNDQQVQQAADPYIRPRRVERRSTCEAIVAPRLSADNRNATKADSGDEPRLHLPEQIHAGRYSRTPRGSRARPRSGIVPN